MAEPLIGITSDLQDGKYLLAPTYAAQVRQVGGVPVILPCRADCVSSYVDRFDGLILSGGDDPDMEQWAVPTHPSARRIDPQRQAFETALLEVLDRRDEMPVLGICLGMQLMGLHHGASLDQHLPDTLATADTHWPKRAHEVSGRLGEGIVHSHHRQALADPGSLEVVARSPDGVIEAIEHPQRPFYVGVQWHPERTTETTLGIDLVGRLVDSARKKTPGVFFSEKDSGSLFS